MGSRNKHLPTLLILTVLAAMGACSRPVGDSFFTAAETARRQGGVYSFDIQFNDTTARYDLDIAARIVASEIPSETLDLDIRIQAPDGNTTIERVGLPLTPAPGVKIALSSGSVTDYQWHWRDFPDRPGNWRFQFQPAGPAQDGALQGLGFSYTIQHDGKR